MKLTEINVALRDMKGNPHARIRIGPDDEVGIKLTIEKSKLMAELKERFILRGAETGLKITDEGEIKIDGLPLD